MKEGEEEQALQDIFNKIRWSGKVVPHGTLVFSLSSASIHGRNQNPFAKYICEHPNTKCMHYYTNDAHGPNMVFLCVHHLNPEATKPKRLRQLMQVFEKTAFVDGTWRMKDE